MSSKIDRFLERIRIVKKQSNKSRINILLDFYTLKKKLNISFFEYFKFDLEKKDNHLRDNFLSALNKKKYLEVINPRKYFVLARNKYITHLILDASKVNKSTLFAYYNPLCKNKDNNVGATLEDVFNLLKKQGVIECVIKTTESSHGEGVIVIKEMKYFSSDIQMLRFDGEIVLLSEILKKEALIFESLVKQTEQFKAFNESSVNTIRIMTALKPDGSSEVYAAFFKAGRDGACIDNAGNGGNVCGKVDVITGQITNVIDFRGWRDWSSITSHPDSQVRIEGVFIENWSSICSQLCDYQKNVPFLRAIGWDVAITDQGPLIIEMNDYWDETGQLFIGDGWLDKIEQLYKSWNNEY